MSNSTIERRNRLNQLLDLYGELLTERQREFMELHYAEDLSFGEIGEQFGISRQAIHDAVKHAEESLETYEAKLHFLERFPVLYAGEAGAESPEITAQPEAGMSVATPKAVTMEIQGIARELRASGGVIYNALEVAERLEALLPMMENQKG